MLQQPTLSVLSFLQHIRKRQQESIAKKKAKTSLSEPNKICFISDWYPVLSSSSSWIETMEP